MVFAMDGWYTYTIIIGARNQHTASGAYEFHIHRPNRTYINFKEARSVRVRQTMDNSRDPEIIRPR